MYVTSAGKRWCISWGLGTSRSIDRFVCVTSAGKHWCISWGLGTSRSIDRFVYRFVYVTSAGKLDLVHENRGPSTGVRIGLGLLTS